MPQANYIVNDQSGSQLLVTLQNFFQALATNNSGNTAPSTTYAGMFWLDTSTNPATIRMRNTANNGWIVIGTLQSNMGFLLQSHDAVSGIHGLGSGIFPLGHRQFQNNYVQAGNLTNFNTGISAGFTHSRTFNVTFPFAFNFTPIVIVTAQNGQVAGVVSKNTTGFTVRQYDTFGTTSQSIAFDWLAIGN